MSDAKSITKNVGFLYIGEIISQVLSFFLVITLARYLGDTGLGKYSFAFSFVTIFLIIADLGLPTLITKEISRNKKLTEVYLTKTFTLKLILNLFTLLVTVIAISISKKDTEIIILVTLAGVSMFLYNFGGMFRAIFQAYEVMGYEAFSRIIERIIAVGLGIYLLMKGYGILSLFVVIIISNLIYYLLINIITVKHISKIKFSVDYVFWKKTLKKSFPFWLTIIFISIYFRIDTIMLGYMKDFSAVGWYNAAYKIIEVLTRIPFLLIAAVFPVLSRFNYNSLDKAKLLYEKSFYYLLVLGLPITIGLFMLADKIILSVYKTPFMNSIIVLKILSFALFFVFVNYLMGYLLNAIDKQKLFTWITGLSTAFNIILNFILIPKFSYIGACVATVASEILNFGLLYYFTDKNGFTIKILHILKKPFLATFAMSIFLYFFKQINIIFLVLYSALIYFGVLLIIKGIGRDEINIIKSLYLDYHKNEK